MKALMTESGWSPLKRRLLMGALLVGITGSQVGCGCECATVAAIAATAAPVVFVAREIQEARKTEREIERMDSERRSHGNHLRDVAENPARSVGQH
jgi:uncharacterized protein YcfJ